jgi:AraC-like DNA-binding protein
MIWLNVFRYFYLLGAVNALFFCILIFSKPQRVDADKIMGVWLIVLSLQLIAPFIFLSNLDFYHHVAGAEFMLFTLHPAFLYFYIRAITGVKPLFRNAGLIILSSLLASSGLISFFCLPAKVRYNIILGNQDIPNYFLLFIIPLILYFVFFWSASNKLLRNYKSKILQVYSYKQNVDLLWLRRISLLFYGLLIITGIVGILFSYYGIPLLLSDYFYFAGLTIFIFLVGFWGYKQGAVFSFQSLNIEKNVSHNVDKFHLPHTQKTVDARASLLKELMEKKKPFFNPTLTIYELASMVDLPPHQLSRLIRKEFNCNFFEFVNNYRIEAFKKLLFSNEYKNYTILAIAFECGFNTKSAFNRIFKEQTGLTPSEFKKNHSV